MIIDVSDPTRPKQVGSYDIIRGCVAKILDHYAYVADYSNGLWVHRLDVSNPVSPKMVGSMQMLPGRRYDAIEIYTLTSRTYAIASEFHSALRVFDISDINNPQELGTYPISGDVFDIDVSGPYAYVPNWGAGVLILDISDPTNISEAGRYKTPGWASQVHIADRYAYVSCSDCEDGSLQILDISEPTNPTKVSYYPGPPRGTHICVSHPYAYIADWDVGLRAIDVSIPSQPRLAGSYDSPTGEIATGQKGNSNIYGVSAVGSYVYLGTDSGLLILRVSE